MYIILRKFIKDIVVYEVFMFLRIEKVKVSKSKFLSLSHLKLSQWNELDTQWRDLVTEFTNSITKKRGSQKKDTNKEIVEIAGMFTNNTDLFFNYYKHVFLCRKGKF